MVILQLLVIRTFHQFVVLFSHFIASLRRVVSSSAQSDPQPCQRMINHISYPHCLLPWQLNRSFVSVSRLSLYATSFKFQLSLICLRFSLIHLLYCVIHAYAVSSYSSSFCFVVSPFLFLCFFQPRRRWKNYPVSFFSFLPARIQAVSGAPPPFTKRSWADP